LWIPFIFLPRFVQKIAILLPPFHLSQLALGLVGAGNGRVMRSHWEALIGFAMICLGIAWAGHQRDQKANG
jgi:ABC-2 type transport system permease protein